MRPRLSLVPVARMLFIILAAFVIFYALRLYDLQQLWLEHGGSAGLEPAGWAGGWPPGLWRPGRALAAMLFLRTVELTLAATVLLCLLLRPPQPRVLDHDDS